MDREILKGSLEIILLSLLKNNAMYGYEISKTIKNLSEDALIIGEGTLYPALKRLEEKELIKLHPEMSWAKCVYWMYSILIKEKYHFSRDELILKLDKSQIETRPFFYPIHIMPPYKCEVESPTAEELSMKGINLPSGVDLTGKNIKDILLAICYDT